MLNYRTRLFDYFANQSARRQDSPTPKQTCQAAVVVVPRSAAKNRVGHLWFGFFGIVMEQNGESKPVMIHLVSKKTNSGPSMTVEDELEIMDDSEDELTVVRSNIMRDYSRGSSGSFDQDCNNHTYKMDSEDLDDDTEEEISRLYEDDDCSSM